MGPALTGAGRSPHAAIGVHACACTHPGHTACMHVCWGAMHAHTCARGCQACTYMCHGTPHMHSRVPRAPYVHILGLSSSCTYTHTRTQQPSQR